MHHGRWNTKRGATTAIVQATIGRTLLKLDDGMGGVRMEWTDRDFLIQALDLEMAGIAIPPQRVRSNSRIEIVRSGWFSLRTIRGSDSQVKSHTGAGPTAAFSS